MPSQQLITFLGMLTGVLIRSIVPFLVKVKKHPEMEIKWENKYLVSAFAGLILAIITAFVIYNLIGYEMKFFEALTTAFTLQSLSRETQKALGF